MVANYIDPDEKTIQLPSDTSSYLQEWHTLNQQSYGNNPNITKKSDMDFN